MSKVSCAALVGLLVEEVQRGDFVLVLFQVVGKGLNDRFGLRFGLFAEAGESHLIQVDVVDDLLTLAAGVFDFVAQFRFVEGRAGGGHALGTGGFNLFRQQGIFAAGDALGLGGGQRGLHDRIGVQRGNQALAQFSHGNATAGLLDARLRLVVQLLGQAHQAVGEREHSVVVAAAHRHALQ